MCHFHRREKYITFEVAVYKGTVKRMIREVRMNICLGSSCFSRGNKEVVIFIREYLKKNHLEDKVIFKGARCMGNCSNGPNLKINDVIKDGVTMARIEEILEHELAKLK